MEKLLKRVNTLINLPDNMNTFIIKNAQIVTPDEVIAHGAVRVENGVITAILRNVDENMEGIDAQGSFLLPGIIDIHTDALDLEIVPRPGADIPIAVAFREMERKMSTCGFTTVYHSLHLGYEVAEHQLRSRYSRREVFEGVHQAAAGPSLIHNKIHLRFEVTGVNAYEECLEFMNKGMIGLLSVMDHTPGQGQWDKAHFLKVMMRQGKSEERALSEYEMLTSRPKIEGKPLEELVRLATELRIPVASHDDDTVEKVNFMHALGVRICEFPINMETARHATALDMYVAGGASNVLRGGSLSGNLDVKTAIREGVLNTLCSDYYPPAILHSIFKLHQEENMPLPQAVNLATLYPARAAGIQDTTGSIEAGKQADLLLIKMVEGLPMITHTIASGNIVFQSALKGPVTQYARQTVNDELCV